MAKKPKASTLKNKATIIHSRIIRAPDLCRAREYHDLGLIDWHPRCKGAKECSHCISRRYAGIRTDLTNALCLCKSAHFYVGQNPGKHYELVEMIFGVGHWEMLYQRANASTLGPKFDWAAELERLQAIEKTL